MFAGAPPLGQSDQSVPFIDINSALTFADFDYLPWQPDWQIET